MPRVLALALFALPACARVVQEDAVFVDEPFEDVLVNVDDGDVEIVAGGDGPVRVERRFSSTAWNPASSFVRVDNGTLHVIASCDTEPIDLCAVDLRVFVPAEVSALVGLGWGDIVVSGLEGGLSAETGAGDILVHASSGGTELDTHAGDIELFGVEGDILAQTAAGDITGHALVSAGAIARTSAGDIDLAFVEVGGVDAVTSAGDVGVLVPAGPYALDVSTEVGDVTIQGVTDERGAAPLRVRSAVGDVLVRGE